MIVTQALQTWLGDQITVQNGRRSIRRTATPASRRRHPDHHRLRADRDPVGAADPGPGDLRWRNPATAYVALLNSTTFNGIDFVEVDAVDRARCTCISSMRWRSQTPTITATITGGDSIPTVPVAPIDNATDWSTRHGGPAAAHAARAKPMATSRTIRSPSLTPGARSRLLKHASSRSRRTCPSDFDCAPPPHVCPPDDTARAADRLSGEGFPELPQALIDFSALRYPEWVERSEADFGMMIAEALSAVGDELSYLQDRVAAEATLETATQRRSLVSLARLVDYEPRPATSATTVLQCDVAAPGAVRSRHAHLRRLAPDGGRVPFEIGTGLADTTALPGLGPLELRHRAVLVRRQRAVLARRRDRSVGAGTSASASPPARRC